MAGVCFDTSIFISYKPAKLPGGFLMSAVVVQELTAGASDRSEARSWGLIRQQYEAEQRLLVPTGEQWWEAGNVLSSLLRGEKHKGGGKTPTLHPDEKSRMVRDVLIAVTVRRAGALLVTENVDDFKAIRRFCKVRFQSGSKYFGYGPGEK